MRRNLLILSVATMLPAALAAAKVDVPDLKGQYSQGIYEGNLRVIQRIAREMGVQLSGMPKLAGGPTAYSGPALEQRNAPTCCVCPCCGFLILLILFMMFFGGMGRGRRGGRGWWWLFLLPFLFNRSRGYGRNRPYGPFGGGYGGFGGGMRGGFGHFGGGRGGGASGRW